MPTNGIRTLDEAILEQEFPFIHFFNGRILSGEDLSREQLANREVRRRLAKSIGYGVVQGLELSQQTPQTQVEKPTLRVQKGLAVSRQGDLLNLRDTIDLSLVRTTETTPLTQGVKFFEHCQPIQSGLYIAGAGLYILTIGPAVGSQGRAPVTGLQNNEVGCNSRYTVEGVRFRLVEIPKILFTEEELDDEAHLRNIVAYRCFGTDGVSPFQSMPFRLQSERSAVSVDEERYGLVDEMRSRKLLTDCEVPLAVLYWTADGVKYVDKWSVRRRVVKLSPNGEWGYTIGDRRRAEAEAMVLQFQEQIKEVPTPQLKKAGEIFHNLPPVGVLPLSDAMVNFQYQKLFNKATDRLTFFKDKTYRSPVFIEGARVEALMRDSLAYPPIDLSNGEMVWLYLVRENMEAIQARQASGPTPFMIFSNGHMPFVGEARFDLTRWDMSNYDSAIPR